MDPCLTVVAVVAAVHAVGAVDVMVVVAGNV